MIFNYKTFLIESILHTSDELLDILYEIDHPIADDFISLIDSDIETRYNLLNLTDKNDKISFLPDEQAQRKLKTQDLDYLLNKSSNTINIGRLVRKLLLTNGFKYHDSEIERFVNMFKATYDINKKGYIIKSVKGGELRKWYHEDNHCMDAVNGKGTLGNSCMKYDECQDFFDIYVDNPDVCKLVVLVVIEDGVEKLSARGILWKTNIGYYLDRVYYTYDSEVHLLAKWAYENYGCDISYDNSGYSNRMFIDLIKKDYNHLPYFDTFAFYLPHKNQLKNYTTNEDLMDIENRYYMVQQTNGGWVLGDVYCRILGIFSNDVVWSEYYDSYLPSGYSRYSIYLMDWIYYKNSVRVNVDIDGVKQVDLLPKDYPGIVEKDGELYLEK